MTRPKVERNELIVELREKGYTYSQILEELNKRGFTGLKDRSSVKTQYSRLRKKTKPPGITPSKQITKAPSKQVTITPSKQRAKVKVKEEHFRATYHLTKEQIRNINILSAKRGVDRSALMRDIIKKYLSGQVDL